MTCALCLLYPTSFVQAAEGETTLQALARQFSDKIGNSLKKADDTLAGGSMALRAKQGYESLQDGEMLLVTVSIREGAKRGASKIDVRDPMMAIKQGYNLFYSFTDFNYVAGFAIKIDVENRRADGWYANEDTPFALDLDDRKVRLGDTEKTFETSDIIVENDDFYIRDTVLQDWFNFIATTLPQGQFVDISTYSQFPVQAQAERLKRRTGSTLRDPPQQPRISQPYLTASEPRADVNIGTQWEKRGDNSEPNNYTSYNLLTSNQLLNHEMTGYFNGTLLSSRESAPFQQARINFRKESEKNDLLGPLNARVYEFNDLTPVSIANTGSAGPERGIRVSNQSERYTIDTQTLIEGNGQPGWDVELYRNQSFVAGTTIDDSGRYSFENVQLFAGDNRFRIVQFGLFGERTEEERIITVLPSLVGNMKGYYNMSLTQKDTITYRDNEPKNDDRGSMRFVGRYDRRAGDNLTLRGGLHTRETLGQRDNYFYTGAVTSLGQTILNADVITTSDGPFRSTLTARRRFGRHNASAGIDYLSEDFSETFINEQTTRAARQSIGAALNGPFMTDTFQNMTYDTSARISTDDNGRVTTLNDFGLSSSYKGFRFNNEISVTTDNQSLDRDRVITYTAGVANRLNGYYWRGYLDYEIEPEGQPTSFNLDINKTYTPRLQGNAGFRHRFLNELSEATAGFTYRADKARISPSISYDSESNARARVDVSFGLARDPQNGDILMSSQGFTNKAGLSAFAYLDRNGNGIFDGDDEPLPDVVIAAKQVGTEMITDETGNASSAEVRANRLTDVVMEESSGFEPNWVSGYEGASVLLRPSETMRLEFPVLRGGEIDGTATIANPTGQPLPARTVTLLLVTPDGETIKAATTPFDGFYVIERIHPGVYYMTTDASQSPTTTYRTPEKIVITPEGAQIYGKNIELTRGYNITFNFSATNENPSKARRTKILKPEDIARQDVYIRLGDYRSEIALAFDWYKLKLRTRNWQNRLSPVDDDFAKITRDAKNGLLPLRLKPLQSLTMQEAAKLCEHLVDAGFTGCGVDVVTTYHTSPATEAMAVPSGSKG